MIGQRGTRGWKARSWERIDGLDWLVWLSWPDAGLLENDYMNDDDDDNDEKLMTKSCVYLVDGTTRVVGYREIIVKYQPKMR